MAHRHMQKQDPCLGSGVTPFDVTAHFVMEVIGRLNMYRSVHRKRCLIITSCHMIIMNFCLHITGGDQTVHTNGVARTLKKLRTPKGDYWIKQRFSSIGSLFKMGTSLKGKNLLPEGANSCP